MPVRKENRKHYTTPSFRAAKAVVVARAKGTCECLGECRLVHQGGRCGAPDRSLIVRETGEGDVVRWSRHEACSLCLGGDPECRPVEVVLTVAHLDHDAGNDNPDRMRHFCQLCHNRYDLKHRQANAAETRRAKKEAALADAGQGALPLGGGR